MLNKSSLAKTLAKTFGAVAIAGSVIYGGSYIFATQVKDNEAAIKVKAGKVVDTNVETGVYRDSILPKVDYIKYPTTLQTVPVAATEQDNFTIRTAEKARIFGEVKVKYNIDKHDDNFPSIYTLQKAESLADIEDDIADYTIPAAIDIYKTVKTTDINNNLTEIGKKIAERLQTILDERGFSYIKIADVVPTGMGLSPKADADLEKIVSEERNIALLDAQAKTAQKRAEIIDDQTKVTTKAITKLRESGVPEDQLSQFYCLQLYRDTDKVGEQFAAGCIGGTNRTPVGVAVSQALSPAPTPTPAPAIMK